jgi:hypothetical protein
MTAEFPSNSKNSQTHKPAAVPEKVVEQVVTGEAASRKKPLGRRLREVFIGGDTKSVVSYVITDVLVPQAKDMFAEAVSSGFERLIYGDSRPGRRYGGRPQTGPGPTNYTRYAVRGNNPIGRQDREDRRPTASARTQDIDDILLATRVEAETVVDRLYDLLRDYDSVTVADLHSLIGWSSSYTDQKWGWTDLQGTDVRRVRDGYVLILPKTISLD